MSNLLEKAIIDAEALKEAALKNAEQLVVEKYSKEVKEAVNKILNEAPEDEIGGLAPEDLGMSDVNQAQDEFDSLTGDTEEMGETEDSPEQKMDPESLVGGLPDSFSSEEDELITIKLDSLEADYEEEDEVDGPFASGEEMSDDEIGIDIFDDEEADIQADDFDTSPDQDFTTDSTPAGIDIGITEQMVEEILSELGASGEDIDIDELAERVRVDINPQKSGWAGTPESIMQEYEAMLLAREQDEEVKEENEELRKAVADLKQENKILSSAAKKLQAQNDKYETAFNTLQEKLETMNVSNAKLLYINQALENASLNERQRRKIVEAISKAGTVQEAKIVFETMNDTVTTTSDVKKDATLNEMVSRRSSLLVAARNEQPNKDANPLYSRMQKLAGIKTK
tara:strand:+ start:27510 stop:28703 length:1194 start_codon:yes stop_codon:yes gene_type:complete